MKKRETLNVARALLRTLFALPEKDRGAALVPFLSELRRIHKLPYTHIFLQSLAQAEQELFGPREISLVTAHRIPPAEKEKIVEMFPHAELRAVIDPRLIGGAVLRGGDRVLDSSISGALERMKKVLLSR